MYRTVNSRNMFPFFRETDETLSDRLNLIPNDSETVARQEVMSGILCTLQAERDFRKKGINFLHAQSQ